MFGKFIGFLRNQMGFYNIKMVGSSSMSKFSKRGVFAVSEALVIPFALVLIGMMIFMASSLASAHNTKFETLTPVISYEYSKVVLYSFLNMPINETDSLNIFGDSEDRVVSDLIWLNTEESLDMVDSYRDIYLTELGINFENELRLYGSFSDFNFDSKKIIKISDVSNVPILNNYVLDGNYYYLVPTKDKGTTKIVRFYTK